MEMTTEQDWEKVEAAIWPNGPADGHGSGIYAAHKARVQAEIDGLHAALMDIGLRIDRETREGYISVPLGGALIHKVEAALGEVVPATGPDPVDRGAVSTPDGYHDRQKSQDRA